MSKLLDHEVVWIAVSSNDDEEIGDEPKLEVENIALLEDPDDLREEYPGIGQVVICSMPCAVRVKYYGGDIVIVRGRGFDVETIGLIDDQPGLLRIEGPGQSANVLISEVVLLLPYDTEISMKGCCCPDPDED